MVLDELSFGDLAYTLSSGTLACRASEKTVRLNFKEGELLKLFLSSPGVILSKETIINKVWGYDSDAGDNNVEAYISFLRKKLQFVGSSCALVSVKKMGYRLEEKQC